MKLFTQLALVSAIAVSGNAMAMQALDDAQLSATTGQDGITLTIKPPVKAFDGLTAGRGGVIAIDHIYVHDNDGLAAADGGSDTSGAITLDGFAIAGNQPIVVKIDADGNGAGAGNGNAFLNVNVALPSELVIRTGDIGVAASNRTSASAASVRGVLTKNSHILNTIDVKLGGAVMNIQLGNEVQAGSTGTGNATTMIKLSGSVTNGISITGLSLDDNSGVAAAAAIAGVDNSSPADGDFDDAGDVAPQAAKLGTTGGSITIGEILIRDSAGGANLTLATDIDVSANGLIMTMGGTKTDIMLSNVVLGNAAAVAGVNIDTTASIGDVEIVGLDMVGAQIAISGH
jgi:hypothetical protein